MPSFPVRPEIAALKPYVPGKSIEEIRLRYGLDEVVKLASNENPLGTPPLAVEAIRRCAAASFRYPQSGNPRLAAALAELHGVDAGRIAIGNGSDEILDMLIRMMAVPGQDNVVCFLPCFSIYPIQSRICGVEIRRQPLNDDFSFNFDALLDKVTDRTRLVFITTPDNPSGYCPPRSTVLSLAERLAARAPQALLVIDEAYMDFAGDDAAGESRFSLLASGELPENAAVCRTFSKSYGLAGLRVGYAVLPETLAQYYWRARLPFSVNILAEEAALAALRDTAFREATLSLVRTERQRLSQRLRDMGFSVWPSQANFLLCRPGDGAPDAASCCEALLRRGFIVRPLDSYSLPDYLRVSIGTEWENTAFLAALADVSRERSTRAHDEALPSCQ